MTRKRAASYHLSAAAEAIYSCSRRRRRPLIHYNSAADASPVGLARWQNNKIVMRTIILYYRY